MKITTEELPNGTVGTEYNASVSATGGTDPYIWSAESLAYELSIGYDDGAISGTPLEGGTFTVALTVQDSTLPNAAAVTRNLTLHIDIPLTITSDYLPDGTVGEQYPDSSNLSFQIRAEGGTGAYIFSCDPSTLPPGIFFTTNGIVSGVPSVAGTFPVDIQALDSADPVPNTATATLWLFVKNANEPFLQTETQNIAAKNQDPQRKTIGAGEVVGITLQNIPLLEGQDVTWTMDANGQNSNCQLTPIPNDKTRRLFTAGDAKTTVTITATPVGGKPVKTTFKILVPTKLSAQKIGILQRPEGLWGLKMSIGVTVEPQTVSFTGLRFLEGICDAKASGGALRRNANTQAVIDFLSLFPHDQNAGANREIQTSPENQYLDFAGIYSLITVLPPFAGQMQWDIPVSWRLARQGSLSHNGPQNARMTIELNNPQNPTVIVDKLGAKAP